MSAHSFWLVGDPGRAFAASLQRLRAQGYSVRQYLPWIAEAEIGSTGMTLLVGGHAPHIRIDLRVNRYRDGNLALTVTSTTTGMMGGLLGMQKVETATRAAVETVRLALQDGGFLAPGQHW